MSTKTHTPGPWHIGNASQWLNIENKDFFVAKVGVDRWEDARLISAAPDLLAALEAIVAYDPLRAGLLEQAQAAIRKARGE